MHAYMYMYVLETIHYPVEELSAFIMHFAVHGMTAILSALFNLVSLIFSTTIGFATLCFGSRAPCEKLLGSTTTALAMTSLARLATSVTSTWSASVRTPSALWLR